MAPIVLPKSRGNIKDLTITKVSSKFVLPIAEAAQELRVSESTLTLWCRLSGIRYWPYRKLKSIDMLIHNIHKLGSDYRAAVQRVEPTIDLLEKYKQAIMKEPSLSLQENTLVMIKKMHRLSSKIRKNMVPSKKAGKLPFELVTPKFEMPIEQAAKQLRVNKRTLQIWCRIVGISTWPYRKIKRMETLLTNVQEIGMDEMVMKEDIEYNIQKLEEEIRAIKNDPSIAIHAVILSLMKHMRVIMKKQRMMNGKEKLRDKT